VGERWLEPYLAILQDEAVGNVLEVGCGAGADTRFLLRCGFAVTATDFSAEAIALASTNAGQASFLQHDSRERFPFADGSFDFILASLSLHYFDAPTSKAIVGDLARLLRPDGLLLYRLNSQRDGQASAPSADPPRYYYSEAMCRELFADWETLRLTERTVEYMGRPKTLWEGLVCKA
jgi:SAM-dependent methyltransferase